MQTYDTRLQDETFSAEYLSELTDTEQRELFDRQAAERVRAESERWPTIDDLDIKLKVF